MTPQRHIKGTDCISCFVLLETWHRRRESRPQNVAGTRVAATNLSVSRLAFSPLAAKDTPNLGYYRVQMTHLQLFA